MLLTEEEDTCVPRGARALMLLTEEEDTCVPRGARALMLLTRALMLLFLHPALHGSTAIESRAPSSAYGGSLPLLLLLNRLLPRSSVCMSCIACVVGGWVRGWV